MDRPSDARNGECVPFSMDRGLADQIILHLLLLWAGVSGRSIHSSGRTLRAEEAPSGPMHHSVHLAGDGIAGRGQAYGVRSLRVDGNDTLAMYSAMKAAREMAVTEERPILVEVGARADPLLNKSRSRKRPGRLATTISGLGHRFGHAI